MTSSTLPSRARFLRLALVLAACGLSFAAWRAVSEMWLGERQRGVTGLKTWRRSSLISRMSASMRAKRSS